jgi:hypothetical protein
LCNINFGPNLQTGNAPRLEFHCGPHRTPATAVPGSMRWTSCRCPRPEPRRPLPDHGAMGAHGAPADLLGWSLLPPSMFWFYLRRGGERNDPHGCDGELCQAGQGQDAVQDGLPARCRACASEPLGEKTKSAPRCARPCSYAIAHTCINTIAIGLELSFAIGSCTSCFTLAQ